MASRPIGRLLDLEYQVLGASLDLQAAGEPVYGFSLARGLSDLGGDPGLIGHGTLYKVLARLVKMGLVVPRWEDVAISEADGRPRRRLYEVTGAGEAALASRPVEAAVMAKPRTALA